jgi:hypothetical protein
MGIRSQTVVTSADLPPYDILIPGKSSLAAGAAVPDIGRVREGLSWTAFPAG